jgi:hypothetical protein
MLCWNQQNRQLQMNHVLMCRLLLLSCCLHCQMFLCQSGDI